MTPCRVTSDHETSKNRDIDCEVLGGFQNELLRVECLRARFPLQVTSTHVNLVSMTRLTDHSALPAPGPLSRWPLQDAKARFSELVRRVRSEGPQHVTLHGRDEVVVVSAEEFQRLQGTRTGQALIDALQASPFREQDLAPPCGGPMPVRDVAL